MKLTQCRSCGAEVWWGETADGKKMPIDSSGFGGNIVVLDIEADTPLIRVMKKSEPLPPGARRYKSHFASCPNAKRHRSQPKR